MARNLQPNLAALNFRGYSATKLATTLYFMAILPQTEIVVAKFMAVATQITLAKIRG